MRTPRFVSCAGAVFLIFGLSALTALPQSSPRVEDKVIAENGELDRRLLEAHVLKDAEKLLRLFSESPDVFFIAPDGTVVKGRNNMRASFVRFFAGLDSIRGEIKEVSYMPAGDGVIAVGTAIFYRQPKNAPADQRTVVWTDYRRRENGKWIYVFRHAHWPLASNPQLTAAPSRPIIKSKESCQ